MVPLGHLNNAANGLSRPPQSAVPPRGTRHDEVVPALSPELEERLVRHFLAAVRAELTTDELAFLGSLEPPEISADLLNGEPALKVRLYGQETLIGWDGTESDAVQSILEVADSAAANISERLLDDGWLEDMVVLNS
jgi:hypothetical protein